MGVGGGGGVYCAMVGLCPPALAGVLAQLQNRQKRVESGYWPLHDNATTKMVWCTAYKRGGGGGAYIAQWSYTSDALGKALQVQGGQ